VEYQLNSFVTRPEIFNSFFRLLLCTKEEFTREEEDERRGVQVAWTIHTDF
jgi:hypothetical protein